MTGAMSRFEIARYVNPWKFRREQEAQRLAALRARDGDSCSRCRRPMRFDLPAGHHMGARVEVILTAPAGGAATIDGLCLTHGRCNAEGRDNTVEVAERVRLKAEAALFEQSRRKRRRA